MKEHMLKLASILGATPKIFKFNITGLALGLGVFFSAVILGLGSFSGQASARFDSTIADTMQAQILKASETISPTLSIYLPAMTKAVQARSLGQVTLNSGPTTCLGGQCYKVTVTCPDVIEPITADLKVGGPSDSTKIATLLFASGWTGAYFWDFSTLNQAEHNQQFTPAELELIQAADVNNPIIIAQLQADGYQTVQIRWETKGWYSAKPGFDEGQAKLACRSATLANWAYTQFHQNRLDQPYCAIGHSNGATQVGLSLAHYGLADILSAAVFEGGPNWARVDYACLKEPGYINMWGDHQEIDKAFRGANPAAPCSNQDQAHRSVFEEASLAFGEWDYLYPSTQVAFVFGGLDTTITFRHGDYYYNHLLARSTPFLSRLVVPNAGHFVTGTTEGMVAVEGAIRASCVLH